jgi:hypothetical protein
MEWFLDNITVAPDRLPTGQDLLGAVGISSATRRGGEKRPRAYAVRLKELIIHNNRAWFGEGDIRLDALIVHGNPSRAKTSDFYNPTTFSFPRVADGEALSIGEPGLLLFFGRPLYFLDVFMLVSRDRHKLDNLANLLSQHLSSKKFDHVVNPLLSLAASEITSNAISLALQAAVEIGDLAYQVVSAVADNTIGLYRTSFLQTADNFGLGKHPESGYLTVKDLSFKYEILPS